MDWNKSYMFNPFKISQATDEQIINTYANIQDSLKGDAETALDMSNNLVKYTNMNYLVGEMLARYKEEYNKLKTNTEIIESKQVYFARKKWSEQNSDKAPSIDYFKAEAKEFVAKELEELARMDANIDRFKNAYNSLTEIQNALKKKLEAMKYEL